MTAAGPDFETISLENVLVSERELWLDGPPHVLFRRLRNECPVHWTSHVSEYPQFSIPSSAKRAASSSM